VDASDRGLGAVLSQEVKGEEWLVLYIRSSIIGRYSNIRWAILF